MGKRYLPRTKVAERYGRSVKTITRWEGNILPTPMDINGMKYQDEEELDKLDEARKAAAQ
jgi:hypothetical protein